MKDRKQWVDALQIDPSEVNKWLEEVTSPDVLTFWSLDRGKVDQEKYFHWAKEHYGLARLKDDFFKQPVNTALWTQIENIANWSQQMIPVHEWDGVIFVACVEPDLEIKWSFPVQYVLASPQNLKSHWEALNSGIVEEVEAEPVAPAITDTPAEPVTDTAVPTETPEVPEVPNVISEEIPEAPEGISFNFDTNADGSPEEPVADEDEIVTSPGETPIGLSENTPAAPVLKLDNLMGPAQESATQESETQEEPAAPPQASEPVPEAPVVAASGLPTPPPPQMQTNSSIQKMGHMAAILDQLKNDFESSILLIMKDNKLEPLVWDEHWKPKASPEGPGNLQDASAFRVVSRTQHPYLGHVVDTAVNRSFFKAWNMDEFPEKILVQPVMDNAQMQAVLVCICNPGVKNQVLLSAGAKHAAEASRMMQYDSQSKAA